MNLGHRAGQHILVDEEEICIFAFFDAAALIFKEHLAGHVDGQGLECLLTGETFFRPPRLCILKMVDTRNHYFHDAEWIIGSATQCREVRV